MRFQKYIKLSDLIHFALGIIAVKTGIIVPITILFLGYEIVDTWIQVEAKKIVANTINEILEEKKELRKDIGEYVVGLLIAAFWF